ncbi:MAG TPA: hypothetical protein VNH84_06840 [Candidatus Saccharimonadales bacterium]|nr:hypothetical protein [Candidatus Saccharimonadales bacterium]
MSRAAGAKRQVQKGKAVPHERPLTQKRRVRRVGDARFPFIDDFRVEKEIGIEEMAERMRKLIPAYSNKKNLSEGEYRKFQHCRGETSATMLQLMGRALGLESVQIPCTQADLERAFRDLKKRGHP